MTVAKKRKRCPACGKIIEVGSPIVLTDDREFGQHISRGNGNRLYSAKTGSWHSWHPECHQRVRNPSTKVL